MAKILGGLAERRYRGTVLTSSLLAVETLTAGDEAATRGTKLVLGRGRFDPREDDPMAGAFVTRYREAHGRRPGIYAAYGADAMTALHTAWRRGGDGAAVGVERLWKGLRALDGEPGVTGYLQFDEGGEISAYPRVYSVDGAEQRPLQLTEVADRRSPSGSSQSPAG